MHLQPAQVNTRIVADSPRGMLDAHLNFLLSENFLRDRSWVLNPLR